MKMKERVSKADFLTLLNALSGITAIFYFHDKNFIVGFTFLLCAMIFDGLDGYYARKSGRDSRTGAYLDSIADSVSFALAPAFAVYSMFYELEGPSALSFQSFQNTMAVFASFCVAFGGILRLARYARSREVKDHFTGLPSPIAAAMIMFLILVFGKSGYPGYFGLKELIPLALLGSISVAFLEISRIPYPKVRGRIILSFASSLAALGFVPFVSYMFLMPENPSLFLTFSRVAVVIALFIFFLYILVLPIMWHAGRRI